MDIQSFNLFKDKCFINGELVKIYKCKDEEIDGKIYPNFDTIKNKSRKNIYISDYGKQFTKEYKDSNLTVNQEYIGNSKNTK